MDVALKFEAAYLRSLGFGKVELPAAREVYAKNINGGEPAHEKYKLLQDLIFHYIAREGGRLGMAIHIHSFSGAGNYFIADTVIRFCWNRYSMTLRCAIQNSFCFWRR